MTYRIYLGYTAENDPANDYDIERNVHYTYNVTIKGMNDLVVEAKSDKAKEEEPAPGVEGLVYDAHRSFNFDCHYEQGLMRFKKDELAIFNPDGTLKDDAMISFAIRTPFCDKIISYTKAELEQLKNNNYIPSKEKRLIRTGSNSISIQALWPTMETRICNISPIRVLICFRWSSFFTG